MSVPERGNFLFVYRSAPYMNGSPNIYGAVPIYVWAHPFTFSWFFWMSCSGGWLWALYVLLYLTLFFLSTTHHRHQYHTHHHSAPPSSISYTPAWWHRRRNMLSFNKDKVNNRNYNITEVIVSVVEFDRPPISHHLHAESDRHHENRWPCFVTNCRYPTHLHDGIGDVQIHHCFVYGTFYRTSNNDVGGISNWLYPSRHLAIALSTNRTILFMNGKFRFIDRK
jgi:hypothetical protein